MPNISAIAITVAVCVCATVYASTTDTIITLLVAGVIYKVLNAWFTPLEYMYVYSERPAMHMSMSNGTRRQLKKHIGVLPPPYPNGWWRLLDSLDMPADGDTKYVQCCGQHIALFRSKTDGKVRAVSAYCPHLGANLGVDGKVVGSCISCPFHGWQFDGETGECTSIPYLASGSCIPRTARVRAYHVIEAHGQVYLWYDAEDRPPQWHVPIDKDIDRGVYHYHGRSEEIINVHVQDIPENGSDLAHLGHLHAESVIPFFPSFLTFEHGWRGEWRAADKTTEADKAFMAYGHVVQYIKWNGNTVVPGTTTDVRVDQTGPGIVFLRFSTPLGRFIIIETITPVAPLCTRYNHRVFAEFMVPRPVARLLLLGTIRQTEKDIPVWNHKRFEPKPMVVKGDGPILAYRRWYKQFYSANSIPMVDAMADHASLDW